VILVFRFGERERVIPRTDSPYAYPKEDILVIWFRERERVISRTGSPLEYPKEEFQ
jgi:hypothetical protein